MRYKNFSQTKGQRTKAIIKTQQINNELWLSRQTRVLCLVYHQLCAASQGHPINPSAHQFAHATVAPLKTRQSLPSSPHTQETTSLRPLRTSTATFDVYLWTIFFNTWRICGSEWLPPPCVNRDRSFTFFFFQESFLDQRLMPCSTSAPKFHTLTIIILTVFSIMLRKCQYSPMTYISIFLSLWYNIYLFILPFFDTDLYYLYLPCKWRVRYKNMLSLMPASCRPHMCMELSMGFTQINKNNRISGVT